MPLDTSIAAYTRAWNEQRHADCIRIIRALYGTAVYCSEPLTDIQFDYDTERRHGWALYEQFPQP